MCTLAAYTRFTIQNNCKHVNMILLLQLVKPKGHRDAKYAYLHNAKVAISPLKHPNIWFESLIMAFKPIQLVRYSGKPVVTIQILSSTTGGN